MLVWEGQSRSRDQTMAIGRAIGGLLGDGDLVALHGELGAGKTQLVRGLAQALGVHPGDVSSPTYVLAHEHPTQKSLASGARLTLVHIDAYRLRSLDDLESIGWTSEDETLEGEFRKGAVVVIEWAGKLEGMLGEDALVVTLEHAGDELRQVKVEAKGNWVGRVDALRGILGKA